MMRTYLSYLIVFVVGITSGALPFLLFSSEPAEGPTMIAYNAADRPPGEGAGEETLAKLQEAAAKSGQSCEETLALTQKSLASAIQERDALREHNDELAKLIDRTSPEVPMAFPAELDEAFRPENFEQMVDQLMQECPDVFPPETTVNCSEYPCAMEFPLEHEGDPQQAWRFDYRAACPAINTLFGHARQQPMVNTVGDQTRVQYLVHGTGIGLDQHLKERHQKLQNRIQQRWHAERQAMFRDLHEDACLTEGNPEACRELANAHWNSTEAREIYNQSACDADDADACNSLAWERCYGAGQCDATAETIARKAVDLAPENGNIIHTLGVVLCQRGQAQAAARTWESACNIGHDLSCTEICSP
ncbi:hypothetical protein FRC98_02560 [Lujinxingia vulgaris]|uniref:Tetratricopeptide repeat protein n=1 Tax=Lujinxingia vulgaris TaxID=2600176 RepID=A0A5C6XD45_9DELT|nr:hypothetical protein [Lujinxingia vulgaris]TXD39301.1 hypothetical protein FRC98_02560 [Lujinxingia vulgaris]